MFKLKLIWKISPPDKRAKRAIGHTAAANENNLKAKIWQELSTLYIDDSRTFLFCNFKQVYHGSMAGVSDELLVGMADISNGYCSIGKFTEAERYLAKIEPIVDLLEVSSAMVGNETVIRDKRLTWKDRRAKFVKQRGKFESSNEGQGAVLSQTLSSPKDKKVVKGVLKMKPSMSNLELGSLLEQPAAAAVSQPRVLSALLWLAHCLRSIHPLERLKAMSLRSLTRLLMTCLAISSLMLLSYTIYIRLSDARKASQFIRPLGHDGHTSPVTHVPNFYGSINKDKGQCVFQYDLEKDDDTKALLRKWDLHNPSIISTLMVRVCQCVPESNIESSEDLPSWTLQMLTDIHSLVVSYSSPSPNVSKDKILREMVSGSHIVVKGDDGAYYNWLRSTYQRDARKSSHYSRRQQYAIFMGESLQTLLFGVTLHGDSWMQLEGREFHLGRDFVGSLVHLLNFAEYRLTGRNVGPLGTSQYTELSPLYILFDSCSFVEDPESFVDDEKD